MSITELLVKLDKLQKDSYKNGYLDGVFASQRYHPYLGYKREDENIFFSSAIAYTLQKNLEYFNNDQRQIAYSIFKKTVDCYPNFKNFKGGKTYNFFKTNPMDFFPNGLIMNRFNFFKLADDSDDTAYVYLTDTNNNQNNKWLKNKLVKHANGTLKWNTFLPKNYKYLKTYSVYFSKNMHIEIDLCVLTNILLWKLKYDLPLKKQDKDAIKFIIEAVTSKDYIKNPHIVSPCYPTTSQICYHISRLLKESSTIKELCNNLVPVIINDILKLLEGKNLLIDEVLLHIALLNLNTKPSYSLNNNFDKIIKDSSFFYTSVPLMIPKLWIRKLQKQNTLNKILGLRTKCDAYVIALLLEYKILTQKKAI